MAGIPPGRSAEHIEVVENTEGRYYELRVDDTVAGLLVYEPAGSRRVLTHTSVDRAYRGRGLSDRLIGTVLDDLRDKQMTITTYCSVVERFLEANREYQDLIDVAHPGISARNRPQAGGHSPPPAADQPPTQPPTQPPAR